MLNSSTRLVRTAGRNTGRSLRFFVGVASVLGLAATAGTTVATRMLERRYPARGRFVQVIGMRLHVVEQGDGPPVLLIHGNIVASDDFRASGLMAALAKDHRVVAIDRPGEGHSGPSRHRGRSAAEQAMLLLEACAILGIRRPVVVGHSWGTLVALAMASLRPDAVSGLVLLSGYYFPTTRVDRYLAIPQTLPVVGDVLRHTVLPLLTALTLPLSVRVLFHPLPVPSGYRRDAAVLLAARPGQLQANGDDGVRMVEEAAWMEQCYPTVTVPTAIIAGADDAIVDPTAHAERLHGQLPRSRLTILPGVGHMVHHAAPELVQAAVGDIAAGRP